MRYEVTGGSTGPYVTYLGPYNLVVGCAPSILADATFQVIEDTAIVTDFLIYVSDAITNVAQVTPPIISLFGLVDTKCVIVSYGLNNV
jgi:hypothetical protein